MVEDGELTAEQPEEIIRGKRSEVVRKVVEGERWSALFGENLTDALQDDTITDKNENAGGENNGRQEQGALERDTGDEGSDEGIREKLHYGRISRILEKYRSETSRIGREDNIRGSSEVSSDLSEILEIFGFNKDKTGRAENTKVEMPLRDFLDVYTEEGYTFEDYENYMCAYKPCDIEDFPKYTEYLNDFKKRAESFGVRVYFSDKPIATFIYGFKDEHIAFYLYEQGAIYCNISALDGLNGERALEHELFHHFFRTEPEAAYNFANKLLGQIDGDNIQCFQNALDTVYDLYGYSSANHERSTERLLDELCAYYISSIDGKSERVNTFCFSLNDVSKVKEALQELQSIAKNGKTDSPDTRSALSDTEVLEEIEEARKHFTSITYLSRPKCRKGDQKLDSKSFSPYRPRL